MDKKVFAVATPANLQNDRMYSSFAAKKPDSNEPFDTQAWTAWRCQLLCQRLAKQVSCFVDPGAKVDSNYYCAPVLRQGLLPDIMAKCGLLKWCTVARTQRETLSRAYRMSPSLSRTCGPRAARIQIRWITPFGGPCRSDSTTAYRNRKWDTLISWSRRSCWSGEHCHSASLITTSVNKDAVYSVSWIRMADTLSTCFVNHHFTYYRTVKSLLQPIY